MFWGWENDGSDKKVLLKLDPVADSPVPDDKLHLDHIAYDGALNPLAGEITSRLAGEFEKGVRWEYEGDPAKSMPLYRYMLRGSGLYVPYQSTESLAVFNGEKLHLDGGITVDGEPLTDGQTVRVGQTIRFKQEVVLAPTGPFITELKIGTISAATPGITVDNVKLEDGYLSFTIPFAAVGHDMQINLIATLESGMDKYFETSKSITLKVNKYKLPTPVVSYRSTLDAKDRSVTMKINLPDGVTLPPGLTSKDISVQELSYTDNLFRNTPVTSLKTLDEFENGLVWIADREPEWFYRLYDIRLSADGCEPSDPVLATLDNFKMPLRTPDVLLNGEVLKVASTVYLDSKVSVRKYDVLPAYKSDILDFPERKIATCHIYYREWLTEAHDESVEIDIPQTEEGDQSYFIVDESLLGKTICHRHINTVNDDYKAFFRDSYRTDYHSMTIKSKGKLNISGVYYQDKTNADMMKMALASSYPVAAFHYIEYYSENSASSPYLPYYFSNSKEASADRYESFSCRYDTNSGTVPRFFAAYASGAPGYEDSDVIYFKANGEELKIESPRVYVNGELVAHAELSQDDLTIPFGAEVRIENPNVYTPATVRTSAAEGETLPYKTCFGQHAYRGLPAGVSPDADGNVTFPAVVPGQEIGLELMLMPTSEAFTKSDPTICHLTVNTQTGVEDIDSESNVHEEIYTINGVRVTGKKLQKGVYVVVRNGKATKKVI